MKLKKIFKHIDNIFFFINFILVGLFPILLFFFPLQKFGSFIFFLGIFIFYLIMGFLIGNLIQKKYPKKNIFLSVSFTIVPSGIIGCAALDSSFSRGDILEFLFLVLVWILAFSPIVAYIIGLIISRNKNKKDKGYMKHDLI